MRRSLVCLPDPDGAAVLHAALDPPAAALAAWHEVRPRLDLAPTATPSELHRLLPLAYLNLPVDELPEADRKALRLRHEQTRLANEARLALAERWLALLELGGVAATVLKGMALAVRDYGDLGARPMADLDLLVPRADASRALDLLEGAGWRDAGDCSRDVLWRLHHGSGMVHPDHPHHGGIDLHWELSGLLVGLDPRLEPLTLGTQTATTLDRTDALIHVCLHGLWAGSGATTRWIADAVTLLRAAPAIDADRILAVADEHQVGALLGDALGHLAVEHGAGPLLGDLPAQLRAQRVGPRRALRQRALTAPPDRHTSLAGLAHLRAYWAYTRWEWSDTRALADGPHFLAYLWGAERPAALPATAWHGLRRRLGHRGQST